MYLRKSILAFIPLVSLFAVSAAHAQNLFVANSGSNTIVKFSSDFKSFSTFADSTAGISDPNALAFNSAGNLFVSNAADNTIEEFSADGKSHFVFANATSGLSDPDALAFDSSGNLYVANYTGVSYDKNGKANNLGNIEEFSANGQAHSIFAAFISAPANGDYGVEMPSALAFDSSGNLFIGNYGTGIEKYSANGQTHSEFVNPFTGSHDPYDTSESYTPYGMTFDNTGSLIFDNYDASNIEKVSADGKTFSQLASFSTGVFAPSGLVLDKSGDVFVSNNRPISSTILEFSSSGGSGTTIATYGSGATSYPTALAFFPAAPAAVPEASTTVSMGLLLGLGLGGVVVGRKRARSAS